MSHLKFFLKLYGCGLSERQRFEVISIYNIEIIVIITSIPFPNKLPIKCAVIGTYIFLVLIYDKLNGKAQTIVKNIPHIVKEC